MGTQISTSDVFGREQVINLIWKKLKKKSIIFTAERRIGKTTVMKVIRDKHKPGFVVVYIDVEKVNSISRFVEVLLSQVKPHLPKKGRALILFNDLLEKFSGTEIAGVITISSENKKHWETIIEDLFKCICQNNDDFKLILMLDELPYMLQQIMSGSTQDHKNALTLLDLLRALRHDYEGTLRMIFTGSIGLHHVLTKLQGGEFASEPFNDMSNVEINPLETKYAIELAEKLIKEEDVEIQDNEIEAVKKLICKSTGNFPFYIDKVVSRLSEIDNPVSCEDVNEIVNKHLTDDQDNWEMEHFRSRIDIYYPGTILDAEGKKVSKAKIARHILDSIASSTKSLSINQVWNEIKAKLSLDDKQDIIVLLKSLTLDNYLKSNTEKKYRFRFELIKKWWVLAQGLNDA